MCIRDRAKIAEYENPSRGFTNSNKRSRAQFEASDNAVVEESEHGSDGDYNDNPNDNREGDSDGDYDDDHDDDHDDNIMTDVKTEDENDFDDDLMTDIKSEDDDGDVMTTHE